MTPLLVKSQVDTYHSLSNNIDPILGQNRLERRDDAFQIPVFDTIALQHRHRGPVSAFELKSSMCRVREEYARDK